MHEWKKTSAYSGILASVIFVSMFLAAVANYEGYDAGANFLSALGTGETAIFFNAGAVAAGLLGIVFSYGLAQFVKSTGAKLLMPASAALTGIGVFPENYGFVHDTLSAAFFLLAAIALLSIAMKNKDFLGYSAAAASFISMAFLLTWLQALEHAAAFSLIAWIMLASGYMMRKRG